MRARIRLGMLDPPSHVRYNNASYHARMQNENTDKLDLALRAGKEGVTLLKNGPAGSAPRRRFAAAAAAAAACHAPGR